MPQKKKQNGAKRPSPPKPKPRAARRSPRPRGSDMAVTAPVGSAAQQHSLPPKISRNPRGLRIVHREFISNLANTNGTLGVTKLALNPGLAATFPWLSVQAADWDQYTFHRLKFLYVTRSATTETGSVLLSPDYDASDITPTTEAQMSAYQDTVEDAPWKDQVCILDPRAMHAVGPRKFVRSGRPYGDIKTYDVGNMFLGTIGNSTNSIGKIWIEYDVEFFVPQLGAQQAAGPGGTSWFQRAATQTLTTATPANIDFDAPTFDPLGIGADAAGVFTPPAGSYLLEYDASFNDTSAEAFIGFLELQKNGVTVTSSRFSITAPAQGGVGMSGGAVVAMNGTDTFNLQLTLTGAAGTLTVRAASPSLRISAA